MLVEVNEKKCSNPIMLVMYLQCSQPSSLVLCKDPLKIWALSFIFPSAITTFVIANQYTRD